MPTGSSSSPTRAIRTMTNFGTAMSIPGWPRAGGSSITRQSERGSFGTRSSKAPGPAPSRAFGSASAATRWPTAGISIRKSAPILAGNSRWAPSPYAILALSTCRSFTIRSSAMSPGTSCAGPSPIRPASSTMSSTQRPISLRKTAKCRCPSDGSAWARWASPN